MMKKSSLFFVSLLFTFSVLPLSTHAETLPPNTEPGLSEIPEGMPFRKIKPTINQEFKEFRASNAAIREDMNVNKEQKRMEFKNRLQTFRDQNKKDLLLKLDNKLASVSSRRTTHMSEALKKLQTILDTLKEKEATAKQNGADTTAFDTALASAQTALDAATAAVASQTTKEYVLTVNDETTAKQTVGATVKQMQQDLRDTHKLVMDTKQAVMKAAMELRKVLHAAKPT